MKLLSGRSFAGVTACLIAAGAITGSAAGKSTGEKPVASDIAKQVDQSLTKEVGGESTKLAPRIGDAAYLRRVWLDIVGDIPTPEHVTAFSLDPDPNKRERVVKELLDNPQYGQNWARYWRDVILSRKLEDRAQLVSNPLVTTLTEKFNANDSWDKIATEFITATGDVREEGTTAIQMAQDARTEETTAEMSRIFLGIQIQCCQCHNHPYDHWKREQFHEFAAFFPRMALQQVQSPTRRTFVLISDDRPQFGRQNPNAQNRRGKPEHFMPDLKNPTAEGTKMQPKFFLTSAALPFGTPDAERREKAAEWMTANPWFATAFVNRIWAEFVGEGFYQPIDDIGPDRKPSAPKTVELLSHGFAQSGFDIKWLFQTICATEAYQRESRPRREPDGTPFVANVAQPLRSDQLFNAILTVLEVEEPKDSLNRRRPMGGMPPYGGNASVRQGFEVAFGYDPSDPRETVVSSIPQALAMMNGVRLNLAVRAAGRDSVLGRLLDENKDDGAVVDELYLKTLSREPTSAERTTALAYCNETKNRSVVFEDLLWALLNSSEFSHRR